VSIIRRVLPATVPPDALMVSIEYPAIKNTTPPARNLYVGQWKGLNYYGTETAIGQFLVF